MVLRCTKTGRLFFSTEEATEHAEAFGKEYANFEEVSLDTKVWVCVETGRQVFNEADIGRIKARDPDSKTFEQKDVRYLIELQRQREQANSRKEKFFDLVDQKKLQALTEVKGHGKARAAKALYFTKEKGTLDAAEAWISEHSGDATVDKITDEFLDSVLKPAASGSEDVVMGDGDVVMTDAAAAEAPVEERKIGDPNPPEIKEKVNKELLNQLINDMGFSELRAEKALYKTDNAGIEHAVNWLAEHGEDADIDLPLPKPGVEPPPKPKMSKEEAEAKALELQTRLRQKRAEEEKLSEKEKERMRVESTKMMVEANEKLKEEERKRALEQQRREKEEHEKHRAELKEQLRQDYIERFGCEPPDEEAEKEKSIKEKSAKDQMLYWINQLKKNHKDTNPEGLKTCLSTLRIYIKNLQDNPQEVKFKKLKLDNKAFQTRVAPFKEAFELLDVMGFDNKGDCLEQRRSVPDGWLCGNCVKFIDLLLTQI